MSIDFHWLERQMQVSSLDDEARAALKDAISVIFVPPGMPIVHQETIGNSLYLLYSGSVRVIRKGGNNRMLEEMLSSGTQTRVFGEMSFFSGEAVSANVVAGQDCVVYEIKRDQFRELMQNHSDVAMSLMTLVVRHMASIIRRMDGRFSRIY